MAVIHRSYRLDTTDFHKTLKQQSIKHGVFYPEKLREYAKGLLVNRSPVMDEALILMRFNEEWLEHNETHYDNVACWYLITLAAFLKPNHKPKATGELFTYSQEILTLRMVLEILHWQDEEIEKLTDGHNIKHLFKTFWLELTKDDLPRDALQSLHQSGVGYLGKDELERFLSKLESHRDVFETPQSIRFAIKTRQVSAGILNVPAQEKKLQDVYYRAIEVLSSAKEQNLDLIMILD